MVSHPDISFKFIVNNQVKLQSSGNNNSKDILYHVYGRDISKELLPVHFISEDVKITGFIGKPVITRGNRNYENYFINGRYIKSAVITKAIEEAYKPFLMHHKYPFTSLYLEIDPSLIDVNVHPQKLEIRLKNSDEIYHSIWSVLREALSGKEMIPKVLLTNTEEAKEKIQSLPEPFEENRRKNSSFSATPKNDLLHESHPYPIMDKKPDPEASLRFLSTLSEELTKNSVLEKGEFDYITSNPNALPDTKPDIRKQDISKQDISKQDISKPDIFKPEIQNPTQLNLFDGTDLSEATPFLSKKAFEEHRIIGQIFSTYWLVEYKKELFIIDQHAAHEKVLYEKLMIATKDRTKESQLLLPPIVLTLTLREQEILQKYEDVLNCLGYEFEPFGGNEYSFRAVPADLFGLSEKELLIEFLDELTDDFSGGTPNPTSVLERAASISCKAAVKANHTFSTEEATSLVKQLLALENPYHCPHGRPVIISMSQYELEKKFKRIL
jgi:DNA mismatch repair protein MutL